ncbi:hypothetical protein [Streptomyces profundus]|uniref:hypothetical protein n=1 Tax=Streptomyces profundus TaxID=2867410 RepID=UPI001D15ECCD|nr:hypothetical protein [Streptomyces sp. MA3_2.13]UED85235.1 hypothetical protein K4G22_14385 [Streptomyces sp. MA3_2.13]
MRAGADLRLLRAAVFAAASATLAAAGHLSGGGPGVPLWSLAVGWLAVWAFAACFAGRERRSWPAIAVTLAAAQLLLHLLYCLGQHLAAGSQAGGGHGDVLALAGRLVCGDHAASLTEGDARQLLSDSGLSPDHPAGHLAGHAAGGVGDALLAGLASLASWPMLLGHLLAALAAGWLLRQSEAALWQGVRLADARPVAPAWARALFAALGLSLRPTTLVGARPPAVPRQALAERDHPTPATRGTVLPDAVIRRGPPVSSFALAA